MRMHEVQSSKDIKTFLQIAITINANDPQWIRPLDKDIEEVFDEIQRSNMSKLGEDGKPIYREDGKVLKSSLYFRPNIKAILEK